VGKVDFIDTEGQYYQVNVPDPAEADSFFVFSMVKSGSTLLHDLMADICELNQMPVIDIAKDSFHSGVLFKDIQSDVNAIIQEKGYAYLGFRRMFRDFSLEIDYNHVKKILLVRDPRDVLVSLFFSEKYSHSVPEKGTSRSAMLKYKQWAEDLGIASFVLKRANMLKLAYAAYDELQQSKQLKVYRYEDIIFEKEVWIHDMVDFLGMTLSDEHVQYLLDRYDILPDEENPHAHIRQVKPGNYKKHLSPDCIDQLNEIFAEVLSQYNYEH